MNADLPELGELMARLLSRDEQTRDATRREIQAWPYETLVILLATYWPEGYDLPRPEPVGWLARLRQRYAAPEPSTRISIYLDMIARTAAQTTTDARFAGLILSVLAREHQHRYDVGKSDSQRWMTRYPYYSIHLSLSANAPQLFCFLERPLLSALERLLPQVTPANCNLSPAQCEALLLPLRYPYRDVELTLTILVLLAWLGDGNSLKTVERVERTAIDTDNGRRIRAAANACLTQIRARQDKKIQAQSLLRAVNDADLSAPETLLRPLDATLPDDPPDELLRPPVF